MTCPHRNIAVQPTEIIFPVSKRQQTRRIVLRNPTNANLVVKLRTSCPEALQIEMKNFTVHSNEWVAIPVSLDTWKMTRAEELKYQTLSVYCRSGAIGKKKIAEWKLNDSDDSLYLVLTLKIARVNGFAAPDTVIDLPGLSTLLETPPYPTFGVDDSDCRTARRFDSDTATANEISENDFVAVAPDSMISTAHNVASGMQTARDFNYKGWCTVGGILSTFYPVGKHQNPKDVKNSKYAIFPCGAN